MFPLFFSMTETLLTNVRDRLEEKFASEEAFGDCYVVDLSLSGTKLVVYVDCDSGLSLQTCQQLSRFLEEYIETSGLMPEKYTLEVSSPGIDRPLTIPRQYRKNIGRSVKVNLVDEEEDGEIRRGEQLKGLLAAADEKGIQLEFEEVHKEGKKKKKVKVIRDIPFSQIDKTIVLISFK